MTEAMRVCPDGQLRVSLREFRVLVERVLLVAGAPRGALASAVDLVVCAEAANGDALRLLSAEVPDESLELRPPVTAGRVDGRDVWDAQGTSLLLLSDVVLDLATRSGEAGWGAVVLKNVDHAALALGLAPMAARRGLAVAAYATDGEQEVALNPTEHTVEPPPDVRAAAGNVSGHGCVAVACRAAESQGLTALTQLVGDPWTAAVVTRQLCVDEALWWELFHRSSRALTPASEASRQDTGIVAPDPERGPIDAY